MWKKVTCIGLYIYFSYIHIRYLWLTYGQQSPEEAVHTGKHVGGFRVTYVISWLMFLLYIHLLFDSYELYLPLDNLSVFDILCVINNKYFLYMHVWCSLLFHGSHHQKSPLSKFYSVISNIYLAGFSHCVWLSL